jgi:hypothetical protein
VGKVNVPSTLTTCESRPLFTKVTLPDNPVTVPPIVTKDGLEFESLHPLMENAIAPQARIDRNARVLIFIGAPIDRLFYLALPSRVRRGEAPRAIAADATPVLCLPAWWEDVTRPRLSSRFTQISSTAAAARSTASQN